MDLSTISEDWLNTEFSVLSDIEFDKNLENSSSQRNSRLLSTDPSNAPEPLSDRWMEPGDFLVGSLDNQLHYPETPSQGMDSQLALMTGR